MAESSPRGQRGWLAVLPLVLGLVGLGGWLLRGQRPETASSVAERSGDSVADQHPLRVEALELADRIVREFPGTAEALYVRGLILNRFGTSQEAVACWQQCLELAADSPDVYFWLGWDALRRGDYTAAEAKLRQALQLRPDFSQARLRLAETLTHRAQFAQAIVVLEELVAQEPRSTEGRYRLGQAYSFAGRYAEAVRTFDPLVANDPECSEGWFGLAQAEARLGHAERSRELLERFQAIKTKRFAATKAQKLAYDDARELRRGLATAYLAAARVYEVHDRAREAATCCAQAARLDPDNPEYQQLRAELLRR